MIVLTGMTSLLIHTQKQVQALERRAKRPQFFSYIEKHFANGPFCKATLADIELQIKDGKIAAGEKDETDDDGNTRKVQLNEISKLLTSKTPEKIKLDLTDADKLQKNFGIQEKIYRFSFEDFVPEGTLDLADDGDKQAGEASLKLHFFHKGQFSYPRTIKLTDLELKKTGGKIKITKCRAAGNAGGLNHPVFLDVRKELILESMKQNLKDDFNECKQIVYDARNAPFGAWRCRRLHYKKGCSISNAIFFWKRKTGGTALTAGQESDINKCCFTETTKADLINCALNPVPSAWESGHHDQLSIDRQACPAYAKCLWDFRKMQKRYHEAAAEIGGEEEIKDGGALPDFRALPTD